MALIYSQAHVTFAATYAHNSRVGLYHLSQHLERAHDYTLYNEKGKPYEIFVTETDSRYNFGRDARRRLPLLRRAYFFQERFLSPRVVHFADNMLRWEFQQTHDNERCRPTSKWLGDHNMLPNVREMIASGLESVEKRYEKGMNWYKLVEQYTSCQLSYPKDVLPTLQGVAHWVHNLRRCAYYAGLWESTLLRELLWKRHKSQQNTRLTPYYAPT